MPPPLHFRADGVSPTNCPIPVRTRSGASCKLVSSQRPGTLRYVVCRRCVGVGPRFQRWLMIPAVLFVQCTVGSLYRWGHWGASDTAFDSVRHCVLARPLPQANPAISFDNDNLYSLCGHFVDRRVCAGDVVLQCGESGERPCGERVTMVPPCWVPRLSRL
jgi:hypothetical protein